MKKGYLFLWLGSNLLGLALIPINLFFIQFPEIVSMIWSVLMLAVYVLFLIKGCGKMLSKVILLVCTAIFVGILLFGTYCNPYWNSFMFKNLPYTNEYNDTMSYKEAKADIDYMMQYFKKEHPTSINGIPAEIQQAYEREIETLEDMKYIDTTILQNKIQKILSVLGDGHTTSFANYESYHYLKYVAQRRSEGYNLVSINRVTIDELFKQNSDLYCYETESWGMEILKSNTTSLEGLCFLGISADNGVTYTYEDINGNIVDFVYNKSDFVTLEEYNSLNNMGSAKDEPFVSYEIYEDKDLVILSLNKCKYNQEYIDCLKKMFTEVKQKGINNVAVDIRDNGGGQSFVADEFIKYLDIDTFKTSTDSWRFGMFMLNFGDGVCENQQYKDLIFNGDVYILTSSRSFSSAMMFAEYIKDNKLGTIIGEPPGNDPSGYGEIATFVLPNSKLCTQFSTKKFQRADKETYDILVTPDIECDAENAVKVLYQTISN